MDSFPYATQHNAGQFHPPTTRHSLSCGYPEDDVGVTVSWMSVGDVDSLSCAWRDVGAGGTVSRISLTDVHFRVLDMTRVFNGMRLRLTCKHIPRMYFLPPFLLVLSLPLLDIMT